MIGEGAGLAAAGAAALSSGWAAAAQSHAARLHLGRTGPPDGAGPVFLRPWYAAGLALNLATFILTWFALRSVPLFVVQAAVAGGIAVAAVTGHVLLRARLRRWDAAAVAGLIGGLGLVAAGASPPTHPDGPPGADPGVHPGVHPGGHLRPRFGMHAVPLRGPFGLEMTGHGGWLLLGGAVLLLLLGVLARFAAASRPGGRAGRAGAGVWYAFGSGLASAGTALSQRALTGLWAGHPAGFVSPAFPALVLFGGTALVLFAGAIRRVRVATAVAVSVATGATVPAATGVFLLGDRIAAGRGLWVLGGFLLVVGGACLLALRADPGGDPRDGETEPEPRAPGNTAGTTLRPAATADAPTAHSGQAGGTPSRSTERYRRWEAA